MRPIIDNNKRSIYVSPDNLLQEYTKLSTAVNSGATSIDVINSNGFEEGNFLFIGDIGDDRSEIVELTYVDDAVINCSCLKRSHDNKDKVYLAKYNQVNLYTDGTLTNTATLKADYFTRIDLTVENDSTYNIAFTNGTESEESELINGWQKNLCSVADVYAYEKPDGISLKLLSKIEIASREIRDKFTIQGQDFTDLSNNEVELLRQPTALLALHYAWTELIKNDEDIASIKSKQYQAMYSTKINDVMQVISKENDDIRIYGQTLMER